MTVIKCSIWFAGLFLWLTTHQQKSESVRMGNNVTKPKGGDIVCSETAAKPSTVGQTSFSGRERL